MVVACKVTLANDGGEIKLLSDPAASHERSLHVSSTPNQQNITREYNTRIESGRTRRATIAMSPTANLFNIAGLVFLSHAYELPRKVPNKYTNHCHSVYSSYEHSLLPSSSMPPAPSSILPRALDPKISIPTDIVLETIISVLLLCVGVVLGSPDLKPIQWNAWAGRLERSREAREVKAVGVGGSPFAFLEERPGFLDIRTRQKEYADWVKSGGDVNSS